MKRFVLMMFLSMFFSAAFAEGAMTGNVNVFIGQKKLSSSDWAPWDEQGELGVLIDLAGENWPVGIAIDLLGSSDEQYGFTASTSELDLGLRKVFNFSGAPVHPYIGGGLAFIGARLEYGSLSIDDNGTGLWLSGGFFVTLGEHFNLGLDVRHSSADVDFGTPYTIDAGGNHTGILLGYHW